MKAIWHDTVLAESSETIVVEGNHYFPPESVNKSLFWESDYRTSCPWKGQASYCDVVVGDAVNKDAAWYYPNPKDAAKEITNHFAFWRGVEIVK